MRPSGLTPGRRYTGPGRARHRQETLRSAPSAPIRTAATSPPVDAATMTSPATAIPACTDPLSRSRHCDRGSPAAVAATAAGRRGPAARPARSGSASWPVPRPCAGQWHCGYRRAGPRPVRGHGDAADAQRRAVARLGPVENGLLEHRLQRHLDRPVQPGDRLAVNVPGDENPDVVPRDQLEQRGLVVHAVMLTADRKMLEQHRRPGRGGEIAVEPLQCGRPAVAQLQQRLRRVQAGDMHAARVERVRHGAEMLPVESLGRGIPARLVVARHVSEPAAQRGRDRLPVPLVLTRQPGVGDVPAVQHEVGRAPGDGRVHRTQPLHRGSGHPDMRVGDHREPQAHTPR